MEKDKKFMQILAVICGALLFKFLETSPAAIHILHITLIIISFIWISILVSLIFISIIDKDSEIGETLIGPIIITAIIFYFLYWNSHSPLTLKPLFGLA